jgi:hypothetical protein
MTFRQFMMNMLGSEGEVSSKRVIGLASFIMILIIAVVDLLTKYVVTEFIFDGLMYIVLGAFLSNVLEAFGKRSGKSPTTNVNVERVANIDVTQAPASTDTTTTQAIQQSLSPDKREELEPNEIIG